MPQPPPYNRSTDFTSLSTPLAPAAGSNLVAELEAIEATLAAVRNNLALIQRDDGKLNNATVAPESLTAQTRALISAGWRLRGAWQTGTAYDVADVVRFGGVGYVCLVAHTSGTFSADEAAGRWLTFFAETLVPGPGTIVASMLAPSFVLPFNMLPNFTASYTGATPRSIGSILERTVHAQLFGAVGDGVANDTTALQNAANAAAANGALLVIGRGNFLVTAPITVPGEAAGLIMEGGVITRSGSGIGLILGNSGTFNNRNKVYRNIRVQRAVQSDWSSEGDIGVRIFNIDACDVDIRQAEGFTIGVQLVGDQRGCEDSTLYYGRIVNNRIGLDLRTLTASAWMNSLVHVGGHFANGATVNPTQARFGVRFSREPGAYTLHNRHLFLGPAFELQNQSGAVDAIPFLTEVDSRSVVALGMRLENNSFPVHRQTAGAQDHHYDVAYASNGPITGPIGDAYLIGADYPASATRAGASIRSFHQAAAAHHTPRLVANVPDVRAAVFVERQDSTPEASDLGIEGLAVISSNPSGAPTTLNELMFPALNNIRLGTNDIGLPTSRAVGFVVDCGVCKEFFVAAEGENLRVIVQLFNASETLLDGTHRVLLSNQGITYDSGTPRWWEGNAVFEDATLTRLQRVSILSSTARYAFIGVRGHLTASETSLRALRLYCPAEHAPRVLAGLPRRWGSRELVGQVDFDFASIAAGATAQLTGGIPVPRARAGDHVSVACSINSSQVMFLATIGATETVTVTAWNRSGSAIDPAPATFYARVLKRRWSAS
ncbi:MAG: hypothetical protein N2036_12655 [Bryobacteraceae bacterium]|nr:hypothetical protein [Bryobacteraceae bacterium]